jgi:O-antigen biosynthesis protein
LLRFGDLFQLPAYAYPTVYIVAVAVLLFSVWMSGSYTKSSYGIVRSALGVLLSFLIISTLTFFFKDWGFSRAINLISTAIALLLIPGRRTLHALMNPQERINPVTGRRTLLVGLNEQSIAVLERIRKRDERNYDVQGLIDLNRRRIGEVIQGVPIVGTVENIGKIIQEKRITDIILGPDVLSYGEILSMIGRTRGMDVHYRLVSSTMEFIVGKSNVDKLSSVPLLDVEYALMKPGNRFLKRTLDVLVSLPLTVLLYPFLSLFTKTENDGLARQLLRGMPSVLAGRRSLVGHDERSASVLPSAWPGKPGLTGLAQLRGGERLSQEETLGALLQYVRNYSVFLDIELLVRTVLRALSNKQARI